MNVAYAPVRIIFADDHELFRDGFQSLIRKQVGFELLAEAANGEQLVALTEKYLPDVVLTDIKMPLMDGVQATKLIAERFQQVAIIALSMFNDDKLIIEMLEAGAKGYLLKNAHKEEIIDAINTVAKHKTYYCSATGVKLANLVANNQFNPDSPVYKEKFTDKEKEVMCLICQQYSNKEISETLHLSTRTIEGYRERILEKTDSRNTAGIVVYAIKNDIYKP